MTRALAAALTLCIALACPQPVHAAPAPDAAAALDAAAATELDQATTLFLAGKHAEAYPLLERLAAARSAEPRVYLYKGVIERERGLLDAAATSFKQGLAVAPADTSLSLELATTLSWQTHFEPALTLYAAVLSREPDNLGAQLGRARVLAWSGDTAAARAGFLAVLRVHPELLDAQNGLAFVERMEMHYGSARHDYAAVLQRDPKNAEALEGLQALDAERHTQLIASIGVLDTNAATVDLIGGAVIARDLSPTLRLMGGYHADSVEMARDLSLAGTKPRSIVHRLSVMAIQRSTGWLTLNLGYELSVRGTTIDHAVDAGASFQLSENWHALVGARVYFGDGFATLPNIGLQWSHAPESFLMLQAFRYDDYVHNFANALVLTFKQRLTSSFGMKLGGAYGYHTLTGVQRTLFAGVDLKVARDMRMLLDYEYLGTSFFHHQVLFSVRYDLP